MNALVGYTGFVGSNIFASGDFEYAYNSKNITEAYGTEPDLLVYAGLSAEKYLANNDPKADYQKIVQAESNIKKINPKKLVLISTIDVFKVPDNVDEHSEICIKDLPAYGFNRYRLEQWVRGNYNGSLIVRLPGLFGKNLKKNFIYDIINVIPFMLKADKFNELCARKDILKDYYTLQDNGFYKVKVNDDERPFLKNIFNELGFSSINFTDSRSVYQFYNLERLWNDIKIALDNNIPLFHPSTEPMAASELYKFLTGKEFKNEILEHPVIYNYKTIYNNYYGGKNGYIIDKLTTMKEIKKYVDENNKSNLKK